MFSVMMTAPSTMIAEVDGAEGEEIGRDPAQVHEDEGEEQRERNGQRHDERRAQVVEKQREQHDHEPRALDEVAHDRGHRRADKPVAAVVGAHDDAAGSVFRSSWTFARTPR